MYKSYKSFNIWSDAYNHEFLTLGEALSFFAENVKIKILAHNHVLANGSTAGKDTMVKDVITIGLYQTDNIDSDVPDDVVYIEDQTAYNLPL